MREIARDLYTPAVVRQHGADGGERLRDVLAALRFVYRHRPPETFPEGLTVFATIDPAARPHQPDRARAVLPVELSGTLAGGGALQVLPNGSLLAFDDQPEDALSLSQEAVVYLWRPEGEAFAVGDSLKYVRNPNGYPSAFASPGFFLLEEALTYYYEELARRSTCHILRDGWHDETRLLLRNKPEWIMRRSLSQHLRWALRDHAEVREEQNVTETRPIDVKVTWSTSEMLSLIEIKWLGKSVNAEGSALTTSYSAPSRTNEGAKQLADYMDGNLDEAPTKPATGHLVVFDGRREGVTSVPPAVVSSSQAWAYSGMDIAWAQEHVGREDFADPRRFYLEPKLARPQG
jgi:hypothetical protein